MKSLWRILRFTVSLRRYYVGVMVFSILVALMSQVQPLLTKIIVDEVTKIVQGREAELRLVIICVVAIFAADVGQTIFSNIGGVIGDQLEVRLRRFLSERYYRHLMTLPQHYFDTELSGKVLNRLNRSINQITGFTQAFSNNFLQFIFTTILSLTVIFFYSWQVGVMLAALYPIFIWLTTRTSSKWREYQDQINTENDIATGRFTEAVGQIKVVKSFGREKDELMHFSGRFQRMIDLTWPQSKLWHGQDVKRRLVLNVIFLAVYGYIAVQAARGVYSIGTMVLLLQYAALIRIPIFSISFIVDQSQRAIANTRDYFAAMDQASESAATDRRKKLRADKGGIRFEDVSFGYDAQRPVLKNLTFSLKPGTKTALVGESGEGKTTVSNLLLGLYIAQSGTISIDGQDISSVSHASLRAATTMVFQEPALFSGSIRDNIAYGKKRAGDAEIRRVARAANAHEFIAKLPDGYDTEIGERGLKLSGGQKQRIAIARALLKDAPILILDEATSSLDSRSEVLVQEALERLMKDRTTLVIAHRLSTIESVDTIITLKNGTVDEIGPPAQLSRSGGIYDQLLRLQERKTEADTEKLKHYEMEVV